MDLVKTSELSQIIVAFLKNEQKYLGSLEKGTAFFITKKIPKNKKEYVGMELFIKKDVLDKMSVEQKEFYFEVPKEGEEDE